MFELDVEREFSAAHHLIGYNGQCCEMHGHNWLVQIFIHAKELDEIGISVDFKVLKRELDAVLAKVDHKDLNTVEPFNRINPTSENLARWFYQELSAKLNNDRIKINRVRICENHTSGATYWAED